MITFKEFLERPFSLVQLPLLEDVFAKGDELLAAVNSDTAVKASTPDKISTNLRPLGHQSSTTRGDTVYYAFTYKPSDVTTALLKSMKGSGPYQLTDARRAKFLDDVTAHMAKQFQAMNKVPDVIVTPASSSEFLSDFASALADKLDVKARHIGAFKKAKVIELPDDREAALKAIMAKHLDKAHIDKEFRGDEAARAKMEREVAGAIYRSIKKNGHIVAKELPKMYGKFVKGFVDSALSGDDEYSLMDKNVMVVDDVLSSGSTMSDLFRVAKELLAKNVYGAVVFARTSNT